MQKLAENIKYYRNQRNLSQLDLADKLHISRQAISNWERGISEPDLESISKLSQILQIREEVLLHGKDDMKIMHTQKVLNSVVIFSLLVYCINFVILVILKHDLYNCLYLGVMLSMTGTVVAIFGYSIRNEDYNMIAGYANTVEYNGDELRQSLLAMQLFIVKNYILFFSLILLFQVIHVPMCLPPLMMGAYIIAFIISILYINVKYRERILMNKQDQEISKWSMISTMYFITIVIITIITLALVFSIHGYKNNTLPASVGGGIVMLIMLVNVIWLFLEQKRIKDLTYSFMKSYVIVTALNVVFLIFVFSYPYML